MEACKHSTVDEIGGGSDGRREGRIDERMERRILTCLYMIHILYIYISVKPYLCNCTPYQFTHIDICLLTNKYLTRTCHRNPAVELRHTCRISHLISCLNERHVTACRLNMQCSVIKLHNVVWNHPQVTQWKVSETNESWWNLGYISTRLQFPPLQRFNILMVKKKLLLTKLNLHRWFNFILEKKNGAPSTLRVY